MIICPRCGARAVEQKCKVVCPRCHVIIYNCSEF